MNKNIDTGLFILRLGIGFMFMMHGYPKIAGGIEKWSGLGAYGMGSIGIDIFPVFWGFMASFSEFVGGIMIMLGFYVRFFSTLLFITMVVAVNTHLSGGDGLMSSSHAIESAIIFLSLIFLGPGNHTMNIYKYYK